MKFTRLFSLLAVLTLSQNYAVAQSESTKPAASHAGWYLGLGLGKSDVRNANPTLTVDNGNLTRVFGGYQFNQNIAAELDYMDFGNGSYRNATNTRSGTQKTNSLSLSAVGSLPISQEFSLIGRLGVGQTKSSYDEVSNGVRRSESNTGTAFIVGAGAEYKVTKNWAVRGEVQSFNHSNSDKVGKWNIYSAAMRYSF